MERNVSEELKKITAYIKRNPAELLINEFTREYARSQNEDLKKYASSYISYFKEVHDYKRILWHLIIKRIFCGRQPFVHDFYRVTEPAIYDSMNGDPPSFYNAIIDIKENINKIEAMQFADKQSYDVLAWILKYRLTGNKLLFFREREAVEEQYFDKKYIVQNAGIKGISVCVDMGGFDGDTALQMSQIFQKAKIIVFEPEKKNYRKLKKRCTANTNIRCINKGCGSSNETFYLDGSGDSAHISKNSSKFKGGG